MYRKDPLTQGVDEQLQAHISVKVGQPKTTIKE